MEDSHREDLFRHVELSQGFAVLLDPIALRLDGDAAVVRASAADVLLCYKIRILQ